MKLKFKDGPWDGVEFEADFAPDFIQLQTLLEEQSPLERLGIPQKDPDNPAFDNPMMELFRSEPIEIQDRGHAYEKGETKDGVTFYQKSKHSQPGWTLG